MGATGELDTLLPLILERLTELVDAERATLHLVDETGSALVRLPDDADATEVVRVELGRGIVGHVAQTGQTLRLARAAEDPRFDPSLDAPPGYHTKSLLAAPLKTYRGQTIGVVQVLNKRGSRAFTSDDEALVATFSAQATVAIELARSLLAQMAKNRELLAATSELERRLADQRLLLELERTSAQAATLEELLLPVLVKLAVAVDASGAGVVLADEESGDLIQYVVDRAHPEHLARHGIKAGEGVLVAAMAAAEPLLVTEVRRDPRWHERAEGRIPFAFDVLLALRLGDVEEPIGAFGIYFSDLEWQSAEPRHPEAGLVPLMGASLTTLVRLFWAGKQRERGERLGAIGKLLSQVIHDFKTPMTVISGYLGLLEEEPSAAQRHEYVEEALKQIEVLASMQREVLEFARGEKRLFVRRVLVGKFLGELKRDLGLEQSGAPVELHMDVDAKLEARFDEARMARALHNLARNAVEAMGERGGELTLRARGATEALIFEVSDTGPGIPPELEGRLFQPFATLGKTDGSGLGLAIVKKIVEEHGGRIEVRSSPAGTTFELWLPQVRRVPRAAPRSAVARGAEPRATSAKVSS